MARVLENVSKEILKKEGVTIPELAVAETAEEAREAASKIGFPVVVKALVTVGKRGRAGAVKFAADPDEAESHARKILGMTVRNFPVHKALWRKFRMHSGSDWY